MYELPEKSNGSEMSCLRHLGDDAENVKPHLLLHRNMSLYRSWRG